MQVNELPLVFECQGEQLIGIIHQPVNKLKVGILIVVGGPQYRVGSHRQFLLLARSLAAQGFPVMRFDVRGMGDSGGAQRRFDHLNDDIRAAIDCFLSSCPQLNQVILWGLCDAASAAIFYAYQDVRVNGMVLLNPWVFTEQGAAKTYLKHYYLQRLLSKDFWKKVFSFKFGFMQSLDSLINLLKQAAGVHNIEPKCGKTDFIDDNLPLPTRMRECLRQFSYPVLLILSGRDLTAEEFKGVVKNDVGWQTLLEQARVIKHDLADADHTFSSEAWRSQVSAWTLDWLNKLN